MQLLNNFTQFPKKIRIYYYDKVTRKTYLPLTQSKRTLREVYKNYPDFRYFKLNTSEAPTIEQQDEQQYIKNKISHEDILNGVISMKTWRGKTHIIFWLIEYFKCPTLILCHNIKQAHETYAKLKVFSNITESDISLITSKTKETSTKTVTITTHAGFVKNFERYQGKFDQIIYDECDFNLSFPTRQTYDWCMSSSLIMSWVSYLRGLSGTPYRNLIWEEPLLKLIWPIISKPEQDNNWYNIIPHIYQCKYYNKCSYERTTWSELRTQMFEDAVRMDAQFRTINDKMWKYNLVLVETIKECERFYNEFMSLYKNLVVILHWQLWTKWLREQQEKLTALRDSNTPYMIVWTIDMMGRWIDIPEIDNVFLFAPVKFEWSVIQAIGRALRTSPNKDEVKVYDWQDLPLLTKQAKEREKSYKKEYWENVLIDTIYVKWKPIQSQNDVKGVE